MVVQHLRETSWQKKSSDRTTAIPVTLFIQEKHRAHRANKIPETLQAAEWSNEDMRSGSGSKASAFGIPLDDERGVKSGFLA